MGKRHELKGSDERFDSFLCKKNDIIVDAAYELGYQLSREPLDYSMDWIGEIIDAAGAILKKKGYDICYPFFESESSGEQEVPCYRGTDCNKKECQFIVIENVRKERRSE